MSNYMDISEIRQAWDNGEYYVKMDIPQKVAVDHVFDVDLSVRRNREMAEEWNQNVTNLQNEKWRKQAELSKKLTHDVIDYLMGTYDFTQRQAEIVQSYVYTEKHSYMGDYFLAIDEIADMVRDVLDAK